MTGTTGSWSHGPACQEGVDLGLRAPGGPAGGACGPGEDGVLVRGLGRGVGDRLLVGGDRAVGHGDTQGAAGQGGAVNGAAGGRRRQGYGPLQRAALRWQGHHDVPGAVGHPGHGGALDGGQRLGGVVVVETTQVVVVQRLQAGGGPDRGHEAGGLGGGRQGQEPAAADTQCQAEHHAAGDDRDTPAAVTPPATWPPARRQRAGQCGVQGRVRAGGHRADRGGTG